jgi:hypothetical protein
MDLTLGFLLVGALAVCNPLARPEVASSISLLLEPPHLERVSLDELFGSAGTYLQISIELEVIAFRGTMVEGPFCWFGEGPAQGARPSCADCIVSSLQ